MNGEDANHLKACQTFQFRLEEAATASEKADAIRGLKFQLNYLLESGKLTNKQCEIVTRQYDKLYSDIVDEQDEKKGLNNYAEQSISLASRFKNDSKNWKSSLTSKSLDQLGLSKIKPKDKSEKAVIKPKLSVLQYSVNIDQSGSKGPHLFKRSQPGHYEGNEERKQIKTSHQTNYPGNNKKNVYSCSAKNYQQKEKSSVVHTHRNETMEEDGPEGLEFVTARQQFIVNEKKKGGNNVNIGSYGQAKKSLGYRRGPAFNKFVPPVRNDDDSCGGPSTNNYRTAQKNSSKSNENLPDVEEDERLKGIEPKMVELIKHEIMDHGAPVEWHDIAGLEFAKTVIKEIVVWPMLRPDIFKGLRGPPKGLLLFGPPGTGKTLIGKCIASQSLATFFSISASSLTSKWVGEGEKMVRALFVVARCHQPAVIFIDEIDSLLSQRCDGEHDSSRRIKTEFLIQLDGATTNSDDRLLVVGATNRPQEIDEAARRRLVKRLYIPLPEGEARHQIISNLLQEQRYSLSEDELKTLVEQSEGYSGSDMANLCREAALGPIRSISNIQAITSDQVRPIIFDDFENAFKQVRASVSSQDLDLYEQWNEQFGSRHG